MILEWLLLIFAFVLLFGGMIYYAQHLKKLGKEEQDDFEHARTDEYDQTIDKTKKQLTRTHFLKQLGIGLGTALALILAGLYFNAYQLLGFPDGYLSEYEFLLKDRLYPVCITVSLLFALAQLLFFKQKKALYITLGYLLFLGLFWGVDAYFYSILEHGQGG